MVRGGGGTCARCVGAARRFRKPVLAAVELIGKENRGGELRRGVEGREGASEEMVGSGRTPGDRVALQRQHRRPVGGEN